MRLKVEGGVVKLRRKDRVEVEVEVVACGGGVLMRIMEMPSGIAIEGGKYPHRIRDSD